MTHVRINAVNLKIPIYDSHSRRLIRLPSFSLAKVGTSKVSQSGSAIVIHALKDLELDFAEGDRVSLIGHNGAGKTTLLRLLAGIYAPTDGTIEINGKVFTLLGSSMDLNKDATGYENIDLIASIYDWPKARMTQYVREIEEFTGLGEYLSLPTRVYSAGMQARLAFALATMESPDILLIDEGIGAGDAEFQERVKHRVQQFVSRTKIMVLATHSVELSRALCNKGLVMSKGEAIFFGDLEEALERYGKLA